MSFIYVLDTWKLKCASKNISYILYAVTHTRHGHKQPSYAIFVLYMLTKWHALNGKNILGLEDLILNATKKKTCF